MADNNFRSDRGRDLLAELARLIGQADPHGKSAPANNGFPEEGASHGPNAPDQASEPDEHRLDQPADDEPYAAEDYYEDGASRARRRRSMVLVMAIFALAVAGTAGAVGYRAMFGGSVLPTLPPIAKASNRPNKIVPASSGSHAKNNANGSQAGAATIGSKENLDSREEQPVTIEPPKPAPRVMSPIPIATGQGSPPDMGAPDARAPPDAAPNPAMPSGVAAAANSPHFANANNAAAVARSRGGYAVQVTSERSESKAQAAFRALQAKFPDQLTGRRPIIRRADLGAKGTYYRALVGPFASAEKAAELCSGLKAAGGNCIVQRN